MSIPEAGNEPAPLPRHRGNTLRAGDRADLGDDAVLDQDVNQACSGLTVERYHPDLAQQQR